MRRFEFSATHRDLILRPEAEVIALLASLSDVLALFPLAEPAREIGPYHYALALGPFGVGSFRGTVRAEVRASRPSARVMSIESVPGTGNTDLRARIEVEPVAAGDGATEATRVRMELWASPRRDVPAFLPLPLVQSVARRTVERGLADGMQIVKGRLGCDGTMTGASAPL